jgi:hypothetical protein
MKGLMKWAACFFAGIAFLAVQPVAYAQDATLTNITVSNTRDDLLLYLNLEGAFTEEIVTAILGGVPTSFSFFISLNRVHTYWIDETIADIEVIHTIKYDTLKNEFTVKQSWQPNESLVTDSFAEARNQMTEITSLKIIPLSSLQKGLQYQLRVKAEVSKKTLPLNLHHLLFFLSFWDFETDWYAIDFIY